MEDTAENFWVHIGYFLFPLSGAAISPLCSGSCLSENFEGVFPYWSFDAFLNRLNVSTGGSAAAGAVI